MLDNKNILSNNLLELAKTHHALSIKHWLNYELFTWQWWGKLLYLIIPIIVFYKLLDRKRILEIVLFGLMISLLSVVTDVIGINFVLWQYSIRFLPIGFFAIHDLVAVPIVSMLVYQYCSNWKSYIISNILLAAFGAFIKDPLLVFIHVYKPINWKYIYSFFIFFIITVVCRYIMNKLKNCYQEGFSN